MPNTPPPQHILVFQQNHSGEGKIAAINEFGGGRIKLEIIDMDQALPGFIEDPEEYLPAEIQADLVLDFLTHPDLSQELGLICSLRGIDVVASSKKWQIPGVHTPPT